MARVANKLVRSNRNYDCADYDYDFFKKKMFWGSNKGRPKDIVVTALDKSQIFSKANKKTTGENSETL